MAAAATAAATADGAAPAARATAIPTGADALTEHRLTVLDSGVRIVTEAMPSVRSATLGLWIATGSAVETTAEAGLSHLVEHMLFRGTDRYGSLEIDQIFDTMGAELNAGTGKESTSVYARVIDEHLPLAFDVVSDMVWHPRLAEDDLANEREIVLEEIAMYEDDPQDRVFDVLGEAVFGDHPLGRAVIGSADVVGATSAETLAGFHAAHYAPSGIVIAAAGLRGCAAAWASVGGRGETGRGICAGSCRDHSLIVRSSLIVRGGGRESAARSCGGWSSTSSDSRDGQRAVLSAERRRT